LLKHLDAIRHISLVLENRCNKHPEMGWHADSIQPLYPMTLFVCHIRVESVEPMNNRFLHADDEVPDLSRLEPGRGHGHGLFDHVLFIVNGSLRVCF